LRNFLPPKVLSSLLKKGMGMSTFKRMHTAEERAADAARMRLKYPDRIPVIVEKAAHTDMPELDKKKFLVPEEVTVGQFVHIIASLLASIYHEYKDNDGFLYISYSGEKTFG
jgi:GABA(A) receptor-associated protein